MSSDQTLLSKAMAQKARFETTIAAHQQAVAAAAAKTNSNERKPVSPISVYFRTRPLSPLEIKKGYFPVLFCNNMQTTLYYPSFRILTDTAVDVQEFAFDGNYDALEKNEHVYADAVASKLQTVFEKNGILTVMAYGQTGSGKTYTMSSIAEQLVNDLPLNDSEDGTVAIITIIEIQGDSLRDLAIPHDQTITPACKVLLDSDGLPVFMVLDCFHHGFEMRSTKSTLKNRESSRSHFVCTIKLLNDRTGLDVVIKLVDLAGSEAGSDKKEHDSETIKNVFVNPQVPTDSETTITHIPFRSSKLTMTLKDALDPTTTRFTQTAIFALAAPTVADIPHTFNTYRYALALKSLNISSNSATDDSILEHKSAAVAAEQQSVTKTTPMSWSRLKLERWIDAQFENQVTLTHLLGPKGDPLAFGRPATEFVLPPWKFLYSMTKDEWVQNAKVNAKFSESALVEGVREKYRKLFLKERVVADGVSPDTREGKVGGKGSVLLLAESLESVALSGDVGKQGATSGGGEKKLSRAEIAMAKAKAKGAALRANVSASDGKKGSLNSFKF
ncbi:P-loop containing nucleoside triphosphate hydrolase protein [Obelidium mucronatum]|nr:P-loop containing nucleoside triphosphate hydrolase protein [Obelidium mucronatum]